ncbi:MAG: polyketide cyclase [Chloroflexi bacterium]|nr:MAG: polyketide cyclase [Chloroflexota bacterium]
MHNIHSKNKNLIGRFRSALYDCDETKLREQLREVFAPDCEVHLAFPFEDLDGPDGLFEGAYVPLLTAVPDLERRDFIFMAGSSQSGNWVGCGGHYFGVMKRPFLDIPPTQHPIYMRYAEFFRIEGNKVVEMQAIWDIPQVMMQANAWPLSPSLGVEFYVPGPATQDGIINTPHDKAQADASVKHILDMLTDLGKHPQNSDPAVMQLEKYWHPKMIWYGPAGIGSMRRIAGFRNWHQIPFLKAMPNRRGAVKDADTFFGDGNYVGTTGWPNMQMTLSSDGWLGIAPSDKKIKMRSLDFWRIENGLIRENWVLVDLLSVYDQLGVDVFSRMREITVARR